MIGKRCGSTKAFVKVGYLKGCLKCFFLLLPAKYDLHDLLRCSGWRVHNGFTVCPARHWPPARWRDIGHCAWHVPISGLAAARFLLTTQHDQVRRWTLVSRIFPSAAQTKYSQQRASFWIESILELKVSGYLDSLRLNSS